MENDPSHAFCMTTHPVVVGRDSEGTRGASKRVMQLLLLECAMLLPARCCSSLAFKKRRFLGFSKAATMHLS